MVMFKRENNNKTLDNQTDLSYRKGFKDLTRAFQRLGIERDVTSTIMVSRNM